VHIFLDKAKKKGAEAPSSNPETGQSDLRIETRNPLVHGLARFSGCLKYRAFRARFGIFYPDPALAGPKLERGEICFGGHNKFSQVGEGRNPPLDLNGYAKPLVDIAPDCAAKLRRMANRV